MRDNDCSEEAETLMSKPATVSGMRKPRPCPICDKPSTKRDYPFCSSRCKDVDLSRWLKGSYAIPAAEEDDPDEGDLAPQE